MAVEIVVRGHHYVYEVDYGEEPTSARIIVRGADGGPEGLFFVYADGTVEPSRGRGGFGPNPSDNEGIWPHPPTDLVEDARRIAAVKGGA